MSADPDIFDLSDSITDRLAEFDPLAALDRGVRGHEARWPDLSPGSAERNDEFWAELTPLVEACSATDRRDQVAKSVLLEECRGAGRGTREALRYDTLNNISSPWQGIRMSFELLPHETDDDWAALIERLDQVPRVLQDYRRSLEARRADGHGVPRRQVATAIEQGDQAAGSSSFDLLPAKLADSPADAGRFGPPLEAAIAAANGAYADMTDWLRHSYLPTATDVDGVGEERYRVEAESHLGTEIDPLATYAWGWSEIRRLQEELAVAARGVEDGATAARALHVLRTDPDRAARNAEEFIELMQERQDTALRLLDGEHFDVPDEIRAIDVRIDPPGGALAAHYTTPSEDFSRPGAVCYPISGQTTFPLYQDVTTAYHEGFPGHHLQIGWQITMGDALSRFHRMFVWYPGSGEGWALYAEHLMGELGFLEKPDYVVGLLASQLFRACRVVIDIGCHLDLRIPDDSPFEPGRTWNFELGKAMIEDVSFTDSDIAESEMVRYLGWPGQAIAYKYGERTILELRDEFDRAGVDRRDFHRELLSVGSIGLDLMVDLVRPRGS